MQDTFDTIITEIGGIPLNKNPGLDKQYGLEIPGRIIHEIGTVRMGNNPKRSVLNANCQAHDLTNQSLLPSHTQQE